jgi:transcriptional regulator with XRE-family HTH domain
MSRDINHKMFIQKYAQALHFRRMQCKLTQEELAEKCGLHVNYISRMEKGRINPSILTIIKLAKALKTDVKWFIGNI